MLLTGLGDEEEVVEEEEEEKEEEESTTSNFVSGLTSGFESSPSNSKLMEERAS